MNIEDICLQYELARHQRKMEMDRGDGMEGTKGYEIMGCYECDGYNTKCPCYVTQKIIHELNKKDKDYL